MVIGDGDRLDDYKGNYTSYPASLLGVFVSARYAIQATSSMTATCYLFNPDTRERLCAVPCLSIAIAREVAYGQKNGTINIAVNAELTAGYRAGELLFCSSNANEIQSCLRQLRITLPADPSACVRPISPSSAPSTNVSRANTPNGSSARRLRPTPLATNEH